MMTVVTQTEVIMETRFFAPVVIATAFHALVLLGFNGKHVPTPKISKEKEKPTVDRCPAGDGQDDHHDNQNP